MKTVEVVMRRPIRESLIRKEAEKTEQWGLEALRLRTGDLSTDRLLGKMKEQLLGYVNSRVKLLYKDWYYDDVRERKLECVDITENTVSIQDKDFLSSKSRYLSSAEKQLLLTSSFRDDELTTRRLQVVFDLMKQLDGYQKRTEKAGPSVLEGRQSEFVKIQAMLEKSASHLTVLDQKYSTRHHVHVPGSFFFGSGSWYQSASQNLMRQLQNDLCDVAEGVATVVSSHQKHSTDYDKVVVQACL